MSTKPDAVTCRVTLMAACGCFLLGAVIAGLQFPGFALLVLVGLVARKRHFDRQNGGHAHGTARLADFRDLYENGLIGSENGVILGRAGYTARPSRWFALRTLFSAPRTRSAQVVRVFLTAFAGPRWGRSQIIRLFTYVHLVTFAPTGRGKGVGVLVPNLLSYLGSCVVTDPKGELYGLTGEHRRVKFGHRVVRLDPFALGGPGSDTFNPFDLIEIDSPHLLDMCRDLANMLVVRTGKEHDPYWNDSAELILTAFIAFVAACERSPEHRNLQTVRDLVSSRDSYAKAVKAMQESDACGGMLRRFGQLLSWYVDRELGSVLTSVQRHTNFLDSAVVAASTARSSFDPLALRRVPMTIYLCLPPERLVTLAPLQRMWIGCLLRAVALGGANEHNPVLFLLDEAGHLGHIEALEDAVTLMRGYGVRLWFFFQSVGQLTECFGERAGVFLDNIDTQQFFGINAMDSADVISKRMGDATIRTESRQRGTSLFLFRQLGRRATVAGSAFDQRLAHRLGDGPAPLQARGDHPPARGPHDHLPPQPAADPGQAHEVLRGARVPRRRHRLSSWPREGGRRHRGGLPPRGRLGGLRRCQSARAATHAGPALPCPQGDRLSAIPEACAPSPCPLFLLRPSGPRSKGSPTTKPET